MSSERSFEDQVQALYQDLASFALSLAKDRSAAEDLVQDTVVRALAKRHQFMMGTSLKAWLFVILRNRYYSELRRNGRQETRDPEYFTSQSDQGSGASGGDARLMLEQVRVIVSSMSRIRRGAFDLILVQGASYEEAGKILDIPEGTVKSAVHRARLELSHKLREPLAKRTRPLRDP